MRNESRLTTFTYDAVGRPWRVINAVGDTTRTEYDVLNRVRRTIGALGDTTEMLYGALYLTEVRDAMAIATSSGPMRWGGTTGSAIRGGRTRTRSTTRAGTSGA